MERLAVKMLLVGLLATVLGLPSGAAASSQTWVVDSTNGGMPNPTPDGLCQAPFGPPPNCTLPEAVMEANATGHTDTINFNLPANSTIALQLNVVLSPNNPMTIDGCNGAAATAPCVGINAAAVNSTPIVVGDDVSISGLAVGNGHPEAIFQSGGGSGLTVQNTWLGFTITGAPAGGGAGLDLRGDGAVIGGPSPTDRNVIGNGAAGIRMFGGDNNQVVGNYFGVSADGTTPAPIFPGPGILIDANGVNPATGNQIGGDTASSQNLISHVASPTAGAILINGDGEDGNTVARNLGSSNDFGFLDLAPPGGPGNDPLTGANAGIQPPVVATAPGQLSGSAVPGATMRAYQAVGDPESRIAFVGQAVADGSGAWSLTCPASCETEPPTDAPVAVNQTDPAGNSSEFIEVHYQHSVPPPPGTRAPKTLIDKGPPRKTHKRKVKFRFHADEAGSSFKCKLDRKPFKPCSSPKTYRVRPGKHTFQVEATDAAGNVGAPAMRRFKVLP